MAKSITSTTLLPQRANFSTYAEYHRACLAAKAAMFGGKSMRHNSKIRTGVGVRYRVRPASQEE